MQPKMTTSTVVRMSAFRGISCFECTFAKKRLAGSPPSLRLSSVCDIYLLRIVAIGIPGESVSHATAGGHDSGRGKQQTNEREPWRRLAQTLRSKGRMERRT